MLPTKIGNFVNDDGSLSGFTLFVGAGISLEAPAAAPTWDQLRTSILDALTKETIRRSLVQTSKLPQAQTIYGSGLLRSKLTEFEIERTPLLGVKSLEDEWNIRTGNLGPSKQGLQYSWNHTQMFASQRARNTIDTRYAPEFLFQILKKNLKHPDAIYELIESVDLGEPNNNHLAIAWAVATHGLKYIVTTNFDSYIERALESQGLQEGRDFIVVAEQDDLLDFGKGEGNDNKAYLIKIHGSVANVQSLKMALDDIKFPPEHAMTLALTRALRNQVAIYWGYSARDPDILMKLILEMRRSPMTIYGVFGSSSVPDEIEEEAGYNLGLEIVRTSSSLLLSWVSMFDYPNSNLLDRSHSTNASSDAQTPSGFVIEWTRRLDDCEVLSCLGELYSYFNVFDTALEIHKHRLNLVRSSANTVSKRKSRIVEVEIATRLAVAEAYIRSNWENIDKATEQYLKCESLMTNDVKIPVELKARVLLGLSSVADNFEKSRVYLDRLTRLPLDKSLIDMSIMALKKLALDHVNMDRFERAGLYVREAIEKLEKAGYIQSYLQFMGDLLYLDRKIKLSLGNKKASDDVCVQEGAFLNMRESFVEALISGDITYEPESARLALFIFMIGSMLEKGGRADLAEQWYTKADRLREHH